MNPLSLAIIAKDEFELVNSIVKKYAQFFDEICVGYDSDDPKFNPHEKLKTFKYEWDEEEKERGFPDFSKKRNWLADKCSNEFYFRLDTDDEISDPTQIERIIKFCIADKMDVVYMFYLYSADQDGNIDAGHWRETIIRRRPGMYWKKSIHENVFIDDMANFKGVREPSIKIIHNITPEHAISSQERNWKFLVEEFERDRDNTDPRTIAYIARVLMGRGKYKEAIPFFELLLKTSGWDDDKYFAWINVAHCLQALNNIDDAIEACNRALDMNGKFPDAWLKKGELCLYKQKFDDALTYLQIGIDKPQPDTMFVLDLSVYGYRAQMNMAMAYLGHGNLEKAKEYYDIAAKMAPSNPFIMSYEKIISEAHANDQFFKKLLWCTHFVQDKDATKVKHLINSIPTAVMKDERFHQMKMKFSQPEIWAGNSIAIFCGTTCEEWAPPSTIKGIGGSEEAVIYLSKELTKLGYKVTVFCSCGEMEGEYDGVTYRPFFAFNPNDTFNILISWRINLFGDFKARRRLIWLHDVPRPDMFPADRLQFVDKIIVLSEYHKTLLPDHIPEDKIFVSSNGINLPDFEPSRLARHSKRIIHTSSYDRGIVHLLMMWADIRKEVPEAELHLFYGWNSFDAMVASGYIDAKIKDALVSLMNQPGVTDHGRIGHKALIKAFQQSSIYAYPSHFEEISCISAMKAQACGCIPIVTDYGALQETVKSGIKIPGKAGTSGVNEEFKLKLIELLKNNDLQEELRNEVIKHRDEFSWTHVAQQWKDHLFQEVSCV